jgi:hypothetical protein
VFIGKTSAVTAYCQINGEKLNSPIERTTPGIFMKLSSPRLKYWTIFPINPAAIVVKIPLDILTVYATELDPENDIIDFRT